MMTKYSDTILNELNVSMNKVDDVSFRRAVEMIKDAKNIFVLGLGRNGFMLKSFAMRLMHMGYESFVVGETITPDFEKDDLLIVGSASGETEQLNRIAEKAKKMSGRVLAFTGKKDCTLMKIADLGVVISAPAKDKGASDIGSAQPMASLFEQSMFLVCDSIILALIEMSGKSEKEMFTRHANLE